MSISEKARPKAEYTARKLVYETKELHFACQRVTGWVVPGGSIEFNDLDGVLFALDHVLVSIRTLDQLCEGRKKSDPEYERAKDLSGTVVNGLTAPRDTTVHGSDLIEPDLSRAVQFQGDFIVFPKWKARNRVPASVFERKAESLRSAYDKAVAGRALHDTVLDAIQFFHQHDGALFRRGDEGQIEGLPLPPLPIDGYYRLDPDWPSHEEIAKRLRSSVQARTPAGESRRVDGIVLATDGTLYLCGHTQRNANFTTMFVESSTQVIVDISANYYYEAAATDGALHPLRVEAGVLTLDGRFIADGCLPDLAISEQWSGWVELTTADHDFYARQR